MMRVVIVGLCNTGISLALAHHAAPDTQIVGLVNRSARPAPALSDYPRFDTFEDALALRPDLVVIATHADSHPAMERVRVSSSRSRWPPPSLMPAAWSRLPRA